MGGGWGLLSLPRALGAGRTNPSPGGQGELHERCWVGKGGTTVPSTLRLPLADLGLRGNLDLIVPRGLSAFSVRGGRRFYHSGRSPQGLLVPLLVVRRQRDAKPGKARIEVACTRERGVTVTVWVTAHV